jgi:hypothetical protein
VYVTLHSSSNLRQILDFLVLNIRQNLCGATKTQKKETLKKVFSQLIMKNTKNKVATTGGLWWV